VGPAGSGRFVKSFRVGPLGSGSGLALTHDADGHLISVTRANGSTPQVTSTSYTNTGKAATITDANGNVTTNAYDAADRLLSVTDPLRRVTSFGYDAMNRLVSIANGGTPVASYARDAQGRRKSRTVGAATTIYVTDADNREVLEYDGSTGAVQRWHAFGRPCRESGAPGAGKRPAHPAGR
jgi:YD repeat-containing protein